MVMRPTLSIVVPTMPGRESTLSRLLNVLEPQLWGDHAAVYVICGPSGLGEKVERGYRVAGEPGNEANEWVAIIDDDDMVSQDYVVTALSYLTDGTPDYLGYPVLCTREGRYWMTNQTWFTPDPNWSTYERGVSPKCLLRRSIGLQVPFMNDYTADMRWCLAATKLVQTYAYVDEGRALYHYDWWPHEYGAGEGRDVGTWDYDPARFTWLGEPEEGTP